MSSIVKPETYSIEFLNVRLFFVAKEENMAYVKKFYNQIKGSESFDMQPFIYIALKSHIYMAIFYNNEKDSLKGQEDKKILKEHGLLISIDEYMEALCFSEEGRREVKKVYPQLTDQDFEKIVNKSVWNERLI